MSKYLKTNKTTSSSAALRRVRRNVYWQAGLALTTVILTIVIIFAMTSAWYTNVVQTSGLVFEAESWGFDGQIILGEQSIKAAPGDEGIIHLEVNNSAESMTSVGISATKNAMADNEMRKRLFFYVDTQMTRNGETMDRVYLNSLSNYTYTLFGGTSLTLSEEMHNDAPLKWQWVYDMLGYYVLGSEVNGTFQEIEYLRPVEYDYDKATFDYQTLESGHYTIELKTVDGVMTVEEFLAELSKTDGFEKDIDFANPVSGGYYPVEVDEMGYGVYVYLCTYSDIEMATRYDTNLGQQAAIENPEQPLPSYPVTLTVAAQKTDEDVVPVSSLTSLNTALEMISGGTLQLTEDITLAQNEKILIPEGSQVIVDLNGKKITVEGKGNAVEAQPGSSVILLNGEIYAAEGNAGIQSVGAEVTLNKVDISGFVDCISIGDNAANNVLDSKIRLVDCDFYGKDSAVYISGNGLASEQKTQLLIEDCRLKSDAMVIWGNGDASGNGRWGTDIQIIDSVLESNPDEMGAGIFHPQKDSTLTVYNSQVTGYTGIAIKGGTVSIKASTVIGKGAGDPADFDAEGNVILVNSGFADTGDGIIVESNYGYDIRLEISGAYVTQGTEREFKTSVIGSTYRKSLRIWEEDAANVTVKIISGEFKEDQPDRFIAPGSVKMILDQKNANGSWVTVTQIEQ